MIFYNLKCNPQTASLFCTQQASDHIIFLFYNLLSLGKFLLFYSATSLPNLLYFVPNNFQPSAVIYWQYFKFCLKYRLHLIFRLTICIRIKKLNIIFVSNIPWTDLKGRGYFINYFNQKLYSIDADINGVYFRW
jgi:hypothetical protein